MTLIFGSMFAIPVTSHATVQIDGSSTVFPITEAIAEDFTRANKGKMKATVGISGTGGGFKKFCRGDTPITIGTKAVDEEKAVMARVQWNF